MSDESMPSGVEVLKEGAVDRFIRWMRREYSRGELQDLADPLRGTQTPQSKRAIRHFVEEEGLTVTDSEHDRPRFVKWAARRALERGGGRAAQSRSDGGPTARQPLLGGLDPVQVVAVVVALLFALGSVGGGRSGD